MFNGVITGRPLQLHILPRLNNRCHRSRQFHHRRLGTTSSSVVNVSLAFLDEGSLESLGNSSTPNR